MASVEFDSWGFVRRSSFKARKAEEEVLNEEEWRRYEAECAEEGGLGRDALVRDWELALRSEQTSSEALFELTKRGVPRVLRPRIWKTLSGCMRCKAAAEKRGLTFDGLRSAVPSPECAKYTEQIRMDLKRTFPTHRLFREESRGCGGSSSTAPGKGAQDLFDVLQAYANYDASVHYCQGMNYLAAMLLMVMDSAEDAFWTFVAVLKNKGTDCFYAPGMPGLVRECDALDAVVRAKIPAVHKRLVDFDIAPILFVVPWYNPMFTTLNNWCIVMRIWDLFMLEGVRALRRASLFFLFTNAEKMARMKFPELLPFLLNPPCRRLTVADFVRGVTEGAIPDIVAKSFPASLGAAAVARRKSPRGKGKTASQGFFSSFIEDNPLAKWVKKTLYPDHSRVSSSSSLMASSSSMSAMSSSSSSSSSLSSSSSSIRSTTVTSSRRQRGAAAASRSPKGITVAGKVEQRRLSLSGNDVPCGNDSLNSSLDGFDVSDIVVAPDQCEDFVTYRGRDWRVTMQNPVSPISLESCKLTRKSALKRTHSPPPPYYHSGYDDVVFFNPNTDSDVEDEDVIPMITSTSISMDNGEEDGEEELDKSLNYEDNDKSMNEGEANIGNATPTKKRKTK